MAVTGVCKSSQVLMIIMSIPNRDCWVLTECWQGRGSISMVWRDWPLACSPSTPSLFSVIMPFMQNSWGYAGLSCLMPGSLCAVHKFLIIDICVSSTLLSKEDLEKGHYFGFATWTCCHLKCSCVSTLLQMDSKCCKLALACLLLAKPLAEVSGAWHQQETEPWLWHAP